MIGPEEYDRAPFWCPPVVSRECRNHKVQGGILSVSPVQVGNDFQGIEGARTLTKERS